MKEPILRLRTKRENKKMQFTLKGATDFTSSVLHTTKDLFISETKNYLIMYNMPSKLTNRSRLVYNIVAITCLDTITNNQYSVSHQQRYWIWLGVVSFIDKWGQ